MRPNRVGLGTFPLAGVFNPVSLGDGEKLVRRFIDSGGYYLDTAPLYGNGEIEKLLGRALKNVKRDNYYLITKTVKHVDEQGKLFKSGKYKDVIDQFDNSLLRLDLDYVDCLMVHSPDPDVPTAETLGAMEKLQAEGKVKDLAVSNVNLKELKEYNHTGKIRFIENSFSIINRSISNNLEKYLEENKIYLIPYHLLEIGQLTELSLKPYNLRELDLRRQVPYWDRRNQLVIRDWVLKNLSPLASGLGITIEQLIIAWALKQKFIDFVIVGTTKVKYLKINLDANSIHIDDSVMSLLETKYLELEKLIYDRYGKTMREFRGLNEKYY